jgi:hypothetical protein
LHTYSYDTILKRFVETGTGCVLRMKGGRSRQLIVVLPGRLYEFVRAHGLEGRERFGC